MILGLDQLSALLIFRGILIRILDHAINFIVRETDARGDADTLFLVRRHIFRLDIDNAVDVDVKGDFHLGYAAWRRGDAIQGEPPKGDIIDCHSPLTLQHMDFHWGLVISRGRENLTLGGGDGGIALDELSQDATQRLNAQGKRGDVKQHYVLDIAGKHSALNSCPKAHHFIRVDALVGFFAEQATHSFLHGGNARWAADQNNLVDLVRLEAWVLQSAASRPHGELYQVFREFIKLGASNGDI